MGDTTHSEQELDELIDDFIVKWCGENTSHLLDSDDNDGQRLKNNLLAWHSKGVAEAREVAWKAGHAQGVADTEPRINADRYKYSDEPTDRSSEDGSQKEDV